MDKITEQKLTYSILLGAKLLVGCGLGDWKIKLNNSRSSLAQTDHAERTIFYSKTFMKVANRENIEGVTLHEAAHAILGPGFGHGDEFVTMCNKISPNNLYSGKTANIHIGIYKATCPTCGYSGSCNNKKDKYCKFCFEKDIVSKFEIKKRVTKVVPL